MKLSLAALGYRAIRFLCVQSSDSFLKKKLPLIASLYRRFDKTHALNVHFNILTLSKVKKIDTEEIEKKIFEHFAMYMVEFFRCKSKRAIQITEGIENSFYQQFGKPGEKTNLILVAHYGNWELALQHLLQAGYSVTTVALNHQSKEVDQFFLDLRKHPRLNSVYLDEGLKPCIKAMKNKEVLALACERDYTNHGIPVKLAGESITIPKGPAWFIQKYKPDTFRGVYKRKDIGVFEPNVQKIHFEENSSLEEISQRIINNLFEPIFEDPSQWITFDDFFHKRNE